MRHAIAASALCAAAALTAGCADDAAATEPWPTTPTARTVLYEVTSTTEDMSADITLATPGGGTHQAGGLVVPVRNEGAAKPGLTYTYRPGEFAYISAQNQRGWGDISCRITVDGTVLAENTSTGGYTIATCQTSVP